MGLLSCARMNSEERKRSGNEAHGRGIMEDAHVRGTGKQNRMVNEMVRAIFLDIDGTLRDERTGVPESAVEAIRMCRRKGIQVVICTGRNMAAIQPDVSRIETDGIIAGGGCLILMGGRVQKISFFQNEEMRALLGALWEKHLPFSMESQETIFMNRAAAEWLKLDFEAKMRGLEPKERERRGRENGICYESTLETYRAERDCIHKICLWIPRAYACELTALAEKLGTVAQQNEILRGSLKGWTYLELLPPGCSKGTAIREWCGCRGIRLCETLSFGDGKNDIDMLRTTGIGVAMKNGDEELKQYASAVCEAASEDGIYRELVRQRIIGGENDEWCIPGEGTVVEGRSRISDLPQEF